MNFPRCLNELKPYTPNPKPLTRRPKHPKPKPSKSTLGHLPSAILQIPSLTPKNRKRQTGGCTNERGGSQWRSVALRTAPAQGIWQGLARFAWQVYSGIYKGLHMVWGVHRSTHNPKNKIWSWGVPEISMGIRRNIFL